MKKKKIKTVYKEDTGETVYSMAPLYGRTPEEQEEYDRKLENRVEATKKERGAMIRAAFAVYGPVLLITVGAFFAAALLLYFFLK